MHSLIYTLNGKYVSVHYDCEIAHVYYPHDTDVQVDILPVMHEEDIENLYNRIYNYRGEDD